MCSSTSGSRSELKTILAILVALAATETALRSVENTLSDNLRHINSIPGLARELGHGSRPKVLFLGNSYTRRDTHLDIVSAECDRNGITSLNAIKVVPDATAVTDWYYTFKTFFAEPGIVPDVAVIGFTITRHLSDQSPIDARLLSRRFCSMHHISEVFSKDIRDLEGRLEFLLARVSSAFANQYFVRRRLLDRIIPNYKAGTRAQSRTERATRAKTDHVTFTRLLRFIDLLKENGVTAVFVAMPASKFEHYPPEMTDIFARKEVTFLDLRKVPGITADDFCDGSYLNDTAGRRYSLSLAESLMPLLLAEQHSHLDMPGE